MCKAPNKSKITTFLRQCLTSTSAKADLSALYSPSDLSVEQVELEDMRTYHVYARCNLPHGVCPYCGHVSRCVHSRYHRTIADLSILGHPVIITFEARKFFCHNPDCRKKTFAEQTKSCKASNVWASISWPAQTKNGLQRPVLQLNCGRTTFFSSSQLF